MNNFLVFHLWGLITLEGEFRKYETIRGRNSHLSVSMGEQNSFLIHLEFLDCWGSGVFVHVCERDLFLISLNTVSQTQLVTSCKKYGNAPLFISRKCVQLLGEGFFEQSIVVFPTYCQIHTNAFHKKFPSYSIQLLQSNQGQFPFKCCNIKPLMRCVFVCVTHIVYMLMFAHVCFYSVHKLWWRAWRVVYVLYTLHSPLTAKHECLTVCSWPHT